LQRLITSIIFYLFIVCTNASAYSKEISTEALELLRQYYYDPSVLENQEIADTCLKYYRSPKAQISCILRQINDPYTKLLSKEQTDAEQNRISSQRYSFGVEVGESDSKSGDVLIIEDILEGSSAEKAGLKRGDLILAINGIDCRHYKKDERKSLLERPHSAKKLSLDLQRGDYYFFSRELSVQKVKSESPIELKVFDDGEIIYLKMDLLSRQLPQEFLSLLATQKALKSKAMILDLQGNEGGLITNAVDIADVFLPRGAVISRILQKGEYAKTLKSTTSVFYDKPLVILIDKQTASTSEIISAALQENGRGILLGERSYGKGSMQKIKSLSDGSSLHITIAQLRTPKGRKFDQIGLRPNIYVNDHQKQLEVALRYIRRHMIE